jgi:hypothetical protein
MACPDCYTRKAWNYEEGYIDGASIGIAFGIVITFLLLRWWG